MQQAIETGIEFPRDGERIEPGHYAIKVRADAALVEVAIDDRNWLPCRVEAGAWVYDWSGYLAGGHTIHARAHGADGIVALAPRRVTVSDAKKGIGPGPDAEAAIAKLREHNALFGELWFTELSGRPWRYDIAQHQVDEDCFERGVTLDGPVTGKPWKGLITTTPDPGSVFLDPVATAPTVALFCDVDDTGAPGLDPRQVLKRAQRRLQETGVAQKFVIGAESEFFLLDGPHGPPVADEVVWDFLRGLALALTRTGIHVDGFRYGPNPGQGRVQMRNDEALRIADQTLFYRYIAKTLGRRLGVTVKFVPKPLPGDGYANFPTHHALWKDGRNIFHSDSGWNLTSEEARWYAGGLLEHAPALLALVSPTVNSFRRLDAPDAPTELNLSSVSPRSAVRIPARSPNPAARRVKFKLADTTSNPYLAFAAMLMAGLDGIARKIEPPIETPARKTLPRSLSDALDALKADEGFLLAGGVFTQPILDAWIADRRLTQLERLRRQPHPMETHEASRFDD